MKDLDPTQHKLDSIIGRYIFKEKIRCGLSNCHTLHAKGYIASTKDGLETNIGKDCGKTYFGVDFETMSRLLDRDITEAENRDRLWNFSFRLDDVERRVAALRSADKGADWLHTKLRSLITPNAGCPEAVVRQVSSMVKMRSTKLSVQREATEAEIVQRETAENRRLPRPFYTEEQVADISGLEALYPENDLRKLLVLDLAEKIKDFQTLNIDTMSYEELRRWVKWVDSVEPTRDRASDAVTRGRTLLATANLQPLLKIMNRQADTDAFRAYLKGLL
ncbi:MAG: hypothetical protein ACT4P8_21705 [Betaproteobacteria bacterium]